MSEIQGDHRWYRPESYLGFMRRLTHITPWAWIDTQLSVVNTAVTKCTNVWWHG